MENKNDDSFLSISSEEEQEEENDSDNNNNKTHSKKENYHNLFKGITSESFNHNLNNEKSKDNKEKEDINKNYILNLREKLNKNTKKIKDRKILILPAPENNLSDYHQKIEEDDNKGYIKLMNPDNLNIKKAEKTENLEFNNDTLNNFNNDKNIISINQKDILDSNWEIKYINNILKKDMKDANKKDKDEIEENKNGKKRKRDKNDEDEFEEERVRSKYSKITTKRRYGW
jgi:hypothetical protein